MKQTDVVQPNFNILLDLDCLFDLRIGALNCVSVPFAHALSQQDGYYSREVDVFTVGGDTIAIKEIKNIIDKNPLMALKNAPVAKGLDFVRVWALDKLVRQTNDKLVETIGIHVNTHGFDLSEDEAEAMLRTIVDLTAGTVNVRLVDLNPTSITPTVLTQTYVAWFTYDPTSWLEKNFRLWRDCRMRSFEIFTPKINKSGVEIDAETKRIHREKKYCPYQDFTDKMRIFMAFTWVDPSTVCMLHPKNLTQLVKE